jgi:hypothetical protein
MWKKKLIFFVTFIVGLYYMLEFVVPPTWPPATSSGVVQSVSPKVIDEKTKTSEITIQLTTFKSNTKLEMSDQKTVTCIGLDGPQQVKISNLRATNIIDLGGSERGIVTGTNNAVVKVGVLGETKTVVAKVIDGKSSTLASKVDESGGEQQLDNLQPRTKENQGGVGTNDLITRIGPSTYLSSQLENVNNFLIVLIALAFGYALFSLWFVHSSALRKRTGEWYMSILFFLGLAFGIIAGTGYGLTPDTKWNAWRLFLNDLVSLKIAYTFFSATYSILSFYLASAAYRSFKIKSREAALMMGSSLIVMLGQIPFGVYLTSWLPGETAKTLIPRMSQWLQLVPNTAAVRGIWFGMMVAVMAISLRFWLSLERGAFFDREL